MLDEIKARIESEIEKLVFELGHTLPKAIQKAAELGDLRENADYKAALERQQFVQARLNHLRQRMGELSRIDVDAVPDDRVGFGSTVTVKDLDDGEEDTYTITAGDFIDLEAGHISMASPLGKAFLGREQGEVVAVQLPAGERRYRIERLVTLRSMID